jgi:class 3 adenylate cyclase
MRRSRTVDWPLLATLLPAYLVLQGVALRSASEHAGWWFPYSVSGAQGEAGHPILDRVNVLDGPLRVGDRLLRVGDTDLRGLSRAEVRQVEKPLLRGGRPFPVEAERSGERFEVMVGPAPWPYWWMRLLSPMTVVLAATFLFVRAPHWHLRRRFFVSSLFLLSYGPTDVGQMQGLMIATVPLGMTLTLRNAFEWTEAARPLRLWQRVLPWAIGFSLAGSMTVYFMLRASAGFWPYRIMYGTGAVFFMAALGALVRAYRRSESLERRQLRWVLYGFWVALLPWAVQNVATALGMKLDHLVWEGIAVTAQAAMPLGVVVSVVGYRWLDIDRLISATASLTLLGVAVLGGAVAGVPRVAASASSSVGIDPEAGQIVLSMALAALLVPGYRVLRPWLDRRLFRQQHTLIERFARLRVDLSACRGVEELATRAGEGIDALLNPDSIATYARTGEAFAPLFVRGRAAPLAFEAMSTLVQVLEVKGVPLSTRVKQIGPFERAALETLGAELVVPVLRDRSLVAFTCLAGKRSGDIYTATDLTLLAGVAERCADVLARLDADAVAHEAREVQAALRRYVPGAVAERVLRGEALAPGEREVTVLFVDLRGYTKLAEGLRAEDVFATLNEHTERVSSIVQENGGTVVEFNGDGMMVVFGAPGALVQKELHAVEAARRIVDSMPDGLSVGVGVATGSAFVGSIRASDRLIWTAVGSTTNLASRLQSMTRELDAAIAIDETTRERAGYVGSDFVRHVGLAIRGRTGRFDVFSLPLRGSN